MSGWSLAFVVAVAVEGMEGRIGPPPPLLFSPVTRSSPPVAAEPRWRSRSCGRRALPGAPRPCPGALNGVGRSYSSLHREEASGAKPLSCDLLLTSWRHRACAKIPHGARWRPTAPRSLSITGRAQLEAHCGGECQPHAPSGEEDAVAPTRHVKRNPQRWRRDASVEQTDRE